MSAQESVAARLAEIRERLNWIRSTAASRLMNEDVPALLDALEAALAMHSPDLTEAIPYLCKSDPFVWPCPTYRAVRAKLLGESGTYGN